MPDGASALSVPIKTEQVALQSRGLSSTLFLALGTFAIGTDAFMVSGFLPAMAQSLQVSTAAAGQSFSVFALTYAVMAPIIATLTAHVPRRKLLVIALVLLAIANICSALAPTLSVLIAARVFAAIASASYTPNAAAVSAALVRPELRARALAIVIAGMTIATAFGVPIGNLVSNLLGWRSALGMAAVLALIAALCVFMIMPKLPGGARVSLGTRLSVLKHPHVVIILPLTLVGMAACCIPFAYTLPMLHSLAIPKAHIALMLFLYGVGATLGNIFSGYGTDRWGAAWVLVIAYLLMISDLAILDWMTAEKVSLPLLVGVLMLLWGLSSWAQTPAQQHRLIAAAPHEASLVVAMNSSAINFGIGLGTALGGLAIANSIVTVLEYSVALAMFALVYLVGTVRITVQDG